MSRGEMGALTCLMLAGTKACVIAVILGVSLLSFIGPNCSGFRFLGVTINIIGFAVIFLSCLFVVVSVTESEDGAVLAGACCTMPLLLVLLALGIFATAVSSKGGGKPIPGRSYKEYHVESYSKWMQNKVQDIHNWKKYYKKAVVHGDVCSKFAVDYNRDSLDAFHKRKLSPYESGCCIPPEDCSFTYISPTVWIKPEIGNYSNVDCNRWDNNPETLCFDCQSCKAALLEDVTSHWFFTGIALIVILGIVLLLGICCAVGTSDSSGYTLLS